MAAKKIVVTEKQEETEETVFSAPSDNAVEEASGDKSLASDSPEPDLQKPADAHEPELQSPLLRNSGLPRPVNLKKKYMAALACLVLAAVIVGMYMREKSAGNPLPESVKQSAHISVYYPGSGSVAYTYISGSASVTAGKLMYSLGPRNVTVGDGGRFIRISEQAITGQGPDLNSLSGFSVFKTPAGEAAVGPNGDVLNGVLVTKKTLIILNGLGGVSRQDFIQTINNMCS